MRVAHAATLSAGAFHTNDVLHLIEPRPITGEDDKRESLANKGGNAFPVELPVSKCTDDLMMGNIVLETNTIIYSYELYGEIILRQTLQTKRICRT